jgi:hypothetical protein
MPLSREDFEDGEIYGEELSLGDITDVTMTMFTGIADPNCPVSSSERILRELGTSDKSLTIIEKVDDSAEDSMEMDHDSWVKPLSESNLRLLTRALEEGGLPGTSMEDEADEEWGGDDWEMDDKEDWDMEWDDDKEDWDKDGEEWTDEWSDDKEDWDMEWDEDKDDMDQDWDDGKEDWD